jgi:RES domain-containing protein
MRKMTSPCSFDDAVMPSHGTGPFLPVAESEVDWFNEILFDEIDSVFTSSICCCDECYDDFKAHWPDVAFREVEFQTQAIEVPWLLANSRTLEIYSPAEMSTLRHLVQCRRCLDRVPFNLWIYEHKFRDAFEIEDSIDELAIIGSITPFLLLEHEFAQRVLSEIRAHAHTVEPKLLDAAVYRARLVEDVVRCGQVPTKFETYCAPPAAYVGEGRFNHAGAPMLYFASSAETAAAELGSVGKHCHVATLRLSKALRILDLVDIDEETVGYQVLRALANSALLAAPRTGAGWIKHQYVFSRFVADCARSARFDVIRYGSTKRSEQSNFVLLDPPKDLASIMRLEGQETLLCPAPERRY